MPLPHASYGQTPILKHQNKYSHWPSKDKNNLFKFPGTSGITGLGPLTSVPKEYKTLPKEAKGSEVLSTVDAKGSAFHSMLARKRQNFIYFALQAKWPILYPTAKQQRFTEFDKVKLARARHVSPVS
ncbi:conserved hypothetical protein [Ricinus communis]|uniref:Uncharacterized protein n=1 Tax=Ricinus communis TaxID=3988 RepID=B9SCB9_RICCO|nr:conserved hypothetical protein [Ricinus communis]